MKKILFAISLICSLAISCEQYDDTPLKEAIAELEEKVKALENLDKEVEALQDMVKGLVTVVSCTEDDGRHTLVLSDGKTFDILTGINHMPVITILMDNGTAIWAYYLDGKVEPFTIGGKKVSVAGATPQMRVGENGSIEVSVDGGKSWVATEVQVPASIFSGLEVEDDCVVLTLSDGYSQIRVPMLKESELQFVAFSGKQFFTAGETKTIPVGMVGIESFTVTEKPEGWKASLSDGQLKVTAPAEGAGETSGYIKMLGIGKEPKITQVYVTIAKAPVLLSISADKKVTIQPNPQSCFYGACLLEDFDAKSIAKDLSGVYNPMMSRHPFTSSALTLPLTNLVASVEEGETYVVWVLPATGEACTELDVIYEAVSSVGVNHEVTDVTFENARISLSVKGTDKYYLVHDITVDDLINDLGGAYAASYDKYRYDSSFKGYLSDLVESPLAGTEYSFLVLPLQFGKPLTDEAYEFKVKLADLTQGGSSTVTLEQTSQEYKSLEVKVSATGAYKSYLAVVPEADYTANGYADDKTLLAYLSTLVGKQYTDPYVHKASSLESGSTYYAVAVAVDRQGAMGAPARLKVTTKSVEYTNSTVTIGTVQATLSSVLIPLSSSSDIVKYRYMFLGGDGSNYWYYTYLEDDQVAENALIYGTCDYLEADAATAAKGLNFNGLSLGVGYIFRVVGYDKDGKVTHMAKADVTPTVGAVIKYGEEKWTSSKPTVNVFILGIAMTLDIDFPKPIKKAMVTKMSSEEYDTNFPTTARLKTDYVISHSYAFEINGDVSEFEPMDWYVSADIPYVLVAWEDEDGWHEPLVISAATGEILNK